MKKLSGVRASILLTVIFSPIFTFATSSVSGGMETFAGLVNLFTNTVITALGTLALAVGVLIFFYGVIEYIWARRKGDSKGVEDGNKFMVWGLVAVFIMFSVYGIVNLAQGILFGNKDVNSIVIPNILIKPGTSADVLGGPRNNSAYTPNALGGIGSPGSNVSSNIPVASARTTAAAKKANAASSGVVGDNKSTEECYWGGNQPNYMDGASCNGGNGVCKNAVCDTSPANECYYSSYDPGFLNGDSCNSGQGVCSNGSCVLKGVDTNYTSCPSGQYDAFGGCTSSSASVLSNRSNGSDCRDGDDAVCTSGYCDSSFICAPEPGSNSTSANQGNQTSSEPEVIQDSAHVETVNSEIAPPEDTPEP